MRKVMTWVGVAAVLAGVVAAGKWFLWYGDNSLSVTRLEVKHENLPREFDGFTVVQVSDLHNKLFGTNQQQLVDAIVDAKPDMIVFTGDLIEGRADQNALTLVRRVASMAPSYYVTGNHEIALADVPRLKERLKTLGVQVLNNSVTTLAKGEQKIYIAGVEDSLFFKEDSDKFQRNLDITMRQIPDKAFSMLLSHRPEYFDLYAKLGVNVIFSGHAHGGQVRLPFIGGLFAPGQGYFPRYTAGVYWQGNSALVVSRGFGNPTPYPRIFNRPELVIVTVKK